MANALGRIPHHLPKLKLVALCNRLGVHGLLRSLVVAFLAVAVRSNSGFRTAIIRMLVFHWSTSALPVHTGALRGADFTPGYPSTTTSFRFQYDHVVRDAVKAATR